MNKLKWQEPPARYERNWDAIAAELRANPGRWALVIEDYGNNVCRAMSHRGMQTRSNRKTEVPPHRYDIYARYEAAE